MHISICMCIYVFYACVCTGMSACICVNVCIYVRMYMCMTVYASVYI